MMRGPFRDSLDKTQPGWYLFLMAPNKEGPSKYPWLDPSRLYMDPEAFLACVDDLVKPFKDDTIDLVAGIDAMGFPLGGAIAHKLQKGFITLRKGDKICTEVVTELYHLNREDSRPNSNLAIRKDPFPPGTNVLIVDQWIETGSTMNTAISLIEKCGGNVVGIAVVAIEESKGAMGIKAKYKCSQAPMSRDVQDLITNHDYELFKYAWEK